MGAITPEGNASVYCYTCNLDVVDEQIANHLIAFGLDIKKQKKTDKTMTEIVRNVRVCVYYYSALFFMLLNLPFFSLGQSQYAFW